MSRERQWHAAVLYRELRGRLEPPGREKSMLKKLFRSEEGVTAVEYGLIAALVAVAIIISVRTLGTKTSGTFDQVSGAMP
jgi:pilus assembly protein Flp/PilA